MITDSFLFQYLVTVANQKSIMGHEKKVKKKSKDVKKQKKHKLWKYNSHLKI
jgi:hypothetical protein